MTARKLTPKRRAFVDAYCGKAMGNATEAARMAGYASPHPEGSRLLQVATVAQAIAKRAQVTARAAISTAEERQEWLTRVHRGEVDDGGSEAALRERMKALELLGKMRGDFIERQQVEHSGGGVVIAMTPEQTRQLAAEGDD